MKEGMPKPMKKESVPVETFSPELVEEASVEEVSSPEYWKEKEEPPYSREYVGFQIQVARELANRTGKTLLEIESDYLSIMHPYIWPDKDSFIDIANLSDEEIADAIYEKETEYYKKQGLIKYHDNNRYGCFSYDSHEDDVVDIHFANEELEETGPLAKDKIDRRLHELSDVFAAIKREYPNAKQIRGNSWLYNIDSYKRLFPENYVAEFGKDTRESSLTTARAWGQFTDNRRGLKRDLADQFLKNIQALEEITPETVLSALPYQILQASGPIDDFYKKYEIA